VKKLKYILLLFFSFSTIFVSAQQVKDDFFYDIGQSLKQKPTLSFRFDNRNSVITNNRAWIYGVKLGLEYDNKVIIGLDFSMLHSGIYVNQNVYYNDEKYNVDAKLHLEYASIFAEYIFYNKKKWEFSLPIQLGGGVSFFTYNIGDKKIKDSIAPIIMYEANITGRYKIAKGLGVGMGIGYRIMLLSNPKINQHFTSPIFSIKVILYPFDFIKIKSM
jgi:hypothetical protein